MDGYTRKRPALELLEARFLLTTLLAPAPISTAPPGPYVSLARARVDLHPTSEYESTTSSTSNVSDSQLASGKDEPVPPLPAPGSKTTAGAVAATARADDELHIVTPSSSPTASTRRTTGSARADSKTSYERANDADNSPDNDDDDSDRARHDPDDGPYDQESTVVRFAENESNADPGPHLNESLPQSEPAVVEVQPEQAGPSLPVEAQDSSAVAGRGINPPAKALTGKQADDGPANLPELENQASNIFLSTDRVLAAAVDQLPVDTAIDQLQLAIAPLAGEIVLDLRELEHGVETFFARLSPAKTEAGIGIGPTTATCWLALVAAAALEIARVREKTSRGLLSSADATGRAESWSGKDT